MNRFAIVEAYYWWLADHHEGQDSPEYLRLSRVSRYFRPSSLASGPQDEEAQTIYQALCVRNGCRHTEEPEPSEPGEEDITANDPQGPFFYLGKQIAETQADLRAWMKAHNYYPDVWFISDHGNAHLLTDVWEGA